MQKVLIRVLVAVVAASSLLAVGAPSSGADPVRSLLVDLTVDVTSKPAEVSPAGAPAVFEIVVANVGALQTNSADVNVDIPAGGAFDAEYSSDACAAGTTADVVCEVGELATGESVSFDVVAFTPPTPSPAGGYATTATIDNVNAIGIAGGEVLEAVENTDNNSDTAMTLVFDDDEQKSGFLAEGESMTLSLADGRDFTLTVPSGVDGVIVKYLKGSGSYLCGAAVCGGGFALDFVPHPLFQATDPANALRFVMDFGPADPCHGIGIGAGCPPDVYTGRTVDDPVLIQAPYCAGAAPGSAGPGTGVMTADATGYYYSCINDEVKAGDTFVFHGRTRSIDPPLIPLNVGQ